MDVADVAPGTAPNFASEDTDTVPPVTVNPPVWRLSPDKVNVPEPAFVNRPASALVVPLNSVLELSPPPVRSALKMIEPAPAIEPTVSACEFKSKVAPVAMLTAVESDSTPAPPSFNVPPEIVVAPT
jgi:hypothetical protein